MHQLLERVESDVRCARSRLRMLSLCMGGMWMRASLTLDPRLWTDDLVYQAQATATYPGLGSDITSHLATQAAGIALLPPPLPPHPEQVERKPFGASNHYFPRTASCAACEKLRAGRVGATYSEVYLPVFRFHCHLMCSTRTSLESVFLVVPTLAGLEQEVRHVHTRLERIGMCLRRFFANDSFTLMNKIWGLAGWGGFVAREVTHLDRKKAAFCSLAAAETAPYDIQARTGTLMERARGVAIYGAMDDELASFRTTMGVLDESEFRGGPIDTYLHARSAEEVSFIPFRVHLSSVHEPLAGSAIPWAVPDQLSRSAAPVAELAAAVLAEVPPQHDVAERPPLSVLVGSNETTLGSVPPQRSHSDSWPLRPTKKTKAWKKEEAFLAHSVTGVDVCFKGDIYSSWHNPRYSASLLMLDYSLARINRWLHRRNEIRTDYRRKTANKKPDLLPSSSLERFIVRTPYCQKNLPKLPNPFDLMSFFFTKENGSYWYPHKAMFEPSDQYPKVCLLHAARLMLYGPTDPETIALEGDITNTIKDVKAPKKK
eukprot:GHVT01075541.1.p1 GENE.GHVT01075541.1~~GHVT01075541.1.p1  ORF type:complete len:543 (-),score=127.31 GHVT01075541.1:462-2090(-)